MTPEIKGQVEEVNRQLEIAIQTQAVEEWRWYRALRNQIGRYIEIAKKEYFEVALKNTKTMWKVITKETKVDSITLPRKIVVAGETITSARRIAQEFTLFYIRKIEEKRKTFTPATVSPVEILKKLIPESKEDFKLPMITIKDTERIIKNMKNSNTTRPDCISSRILKMIPDLAAIYLTHGINSSIRQGIFPDHWK